MRYLGEELKVGDNKVWHAGNDGAGSGLDADTFDGQESNEFSGSIGDTIDGGVFTGEPTGTVYTIQIRRGIEEDIPTLAAGELGFCTDSEKIFVGSGAGNIRIDAAAALALLSQYIAKSPSGDAPNTVTPAAGDIAALVLQAHAEQSVPLLRLLASDGTTAVGAWSPTGYISANGVSIGWDATSTTVAYTGAGGGISNFVVPRSPDIKSLLWLDYQDEFAFAHERAASITTNVEPTTNTTDNLFLNNAAYVEWAQGTEFPDGLVFTIDMGDNYIGANGDSTYHFGLPVRSTNDAFPTNIKIETWDVSGNAWVTALDMPYVWSSTGWSAWVSPRWSGPVGSSYGIRKLRVTLTLPTPLPSALRLQRMILYHASGRWDNWHVHRAGDTVYGNITQNATPSDAKHLATKGYVDTAVQSAGALPAMPSTGTRPILMCDPATQQAFWARPVVDNDGNIVTDEQGEIVYVEA